MLDKFHQYLTSKIALSATDWEKISQICVPVTLEKGEFLLREGEHWRSAVFVIKGCIRTFKEDKDGKIRTNNFAVEHGWAGDNKSIQTGKPSEFNIDAVENTEVILLDTEKYDLLCKQIPELNQLMTANLKECLSGSQGRIDLVTIPTADEKYRTFSAHHPELLARLPQYMIASYLGITPESLSRVRKKLAKERFFVAS